jgi:hypothetical protein
MAKFHFSQKWGEEKTPSGDPRTFRPCTAATWLLASDCTNKQANFTKVEAILAEFCSHFECPKSQHSRAAPALRGLWRRSASRPR